MGTVKISGGAYKIADEVGLTGVSPELIDGYVDRFQNNVKRAGCILWADLNSVAEVLGMYTNYQDRTIFVALNDGLAYKVTFDRQVYRIEGPLLSRTYPPIFAQDAERTWIAHGDGRLKIYYHGGVSLVPADPDNSPANPTHVAYLRGYVIANDRGKNTFQWAGPLPTDRMLWDPLDYAEPESNPDTVLALGVCSSDLVLLGDRSVELWGVNGVDPFYPIQTISMGCSARYSFFVLGDVAFWLNSERQIVAMSGRQIRIVSKQIHKVFGNMKRIDDCVGFPLTYNGHNFAVFTFPSEQQTWAMCLDNGEWCQFSYWDSVTGTRSRYIASCSTYLNDRESVTDSSILGTGQTLIGSRFRGKVYKVDERVYTDDGNQIHFLRRTGGITYNTLREKRCNMLTVRAVTPYEAPLDSPSIDPWLAQTKTWEEETRNWNDFSERVLSAETSRRLFIRWRDNHGAWNSFQEIPCDSRDSSENVSSLRRLGMYKTRQYELEHYDTTGFILVEVEDFSQVM